MGVIQEVVRISSRFAWAFISFSGAGLIYISAGVVICLQEGANISPGASAGFLVVPQAWFSVCLGTPVLESTAGAMAGDAGKPVYVHTEVLGVDPQQPAPRCSTGVVCTDRAVWEPALTVFSFLP